MTASFLCLTDDIITYEAIVCQEGFVIVDENS